MGKTNSNLLRLNKKFYFKNISKTNEENSFFLFQSLAIKNFIKFFFFKCKLFVKNLKLYRTNSLLYVFLSFYVSENIKTKIYKENFNFVELIVRSLKAYINKNLKIFVIFQNIIKYFIKLKKLFYYKTLQKRLKFRLTFLIKKNLDYKIFLKNFINIFYIAVKKKESVQLLSDYIVFILKTNKLKKKHFKFFNIFKQIFKIIIKTKISKIKGIKILVKGRLNGRDRAKKYCYNYNKLPIGTFSSVITYYNNVIYTKNGTLGLKLWILLKK